MAVLAAEHVGDQHRPRIEHDQGLARQGTGPDGAGTSPNAVRYVDRATPANSFLWRRGQTQPELLQAMLTVL